MMKKKRAARRVVVAEARPLVVIEWVDSAQRERWAWIDEFERGTEVLICRTVGWVLAETDEAVVVVSSISGEKNAELREAACGGMVIPKVAMVSRRVLRSP